MFHCQFIPVISRPSRKDAIELNPIAELMKGTALEPVGGVSMKTCPHEHDKERT